MELRLVKMVCAILLIWCVAWTPYVIISLWVMFFDANGLSPTMAVVPTVCAKGSAFANALFYGLR